MCAFALKKMRKAIVKKNGACRQEDSEYCGIRSEYDLRFARQIFLSVFQTCDKHCRAMMLPTGCRHIYSKARLLFFLFEEPDADRAHK